MPKVTVLMPSLNVAKYISACMESVLAQTLKDIEILAIDAGSSDGTLEMLEKYAESDPRIKLIHSDKKSYGYQLNLGIALARGEYVGIVETDDMIESDMYETLYDAAIKNNVEYVKGRSMRFMEVNQDICWTGLMKAPLEDVGMFGKVIGPWSMPELLVRDIYLWTGIYKKEFISKVRLNETPGAAFQDQGFLFQTISSASRAVYLDKVVYKYRQDNSNSSIFNKNGFHYIVEEYAYIERFLCEKDENWKCAYYTRMFNQCIGRFEMMAVSRAFWDEASSDIEILRDRLSIAVKNNVLRSTYLPKQRWELLELFLREARDVYSYCLNESLEKTTSTSELLKTIGKQQVIIFGCGRYGKFIHALLVSNCPETVVAYCDNNSELWNTEVQGLLVLSPEQAVEQYQEAVYVITSLKSADIMRKQLQELGIIDKQICYYHEPGNMMLFHI